MSLPISKSLVLVIEFYQKFLSFDRGVLMFLAPGGACKYKVSCSEYTKQMILKEGISMGLYNGLRRIISCR